MQPSTSEVQISTAVAETTSQQKIQPAPNKQEPEMPPIPPRPALDIEQLLTINQLRQFERCFYELADSSTVYDHVTSLADIKPTTKTEVRGISLEQFREAVRKVVDNDVTDEEADTVFRKVDINDKQFISWEDYLSYMQLVLRERQRMAKLALEPYSRDITIVTTPSTNSPTVALLFMPTINFAKKDKSGVLTRKNESAQGRYLALSMDGLLSTWTDLSVEPDNQRVENLYAADMKGLSLWILCATFMPVSNVIVIATSNCELMFYTYGSMRFDFSSCVRLLPGPACCLSFYCDPFNPKERPSYLTWGDEYGGVGVIVFKKPPTQTKLASQPADQGNRKMVRVVPFQQLISRSVQGVVGRYVAKIHDHIVRKVRFYGSLRLWMSCCNDKSTALFVGDLVEPPSGERHPYYAVEGGVQSFDYCRSLNVIVTGGLSSKICLWNPDATTKSKVVGYLEGHISPVIHLEVIERREMLISVGENKDIRVYDLSSMTCIQTFSRKAFVEIGNRSITSFYVNPVSRRLLVATKNIAVLDTRTDDPTLIPLASHSLPINVILYNPIFRLLISADRGSLVCVWDVMTGRKTLQFYAHTAKVGGTESGVEVTAMTFDQNNARLMIATADGTVKLWNFHNANCIRTLWKPNNMEISCLAWSTGRILTAGWDRRVLMYPDLTGQKKARSFKPSHEDDILSVAIYPPRYAATGCADGTIMIWSLDTSHPLFKYYTYDIRRRAMNNFKLVLLDQQPVAASNVIGSQGHQMTGIKSLHLTNSDEREKDVSDDDDEEGEILTSFDYVEGQMEDDDLEPQRQTSEASNRLDEQIDSSSGFSTQDSACNQPLSVASHKAGVEVLIYLEKRTIKDGTAVLLSCMSDGWILGWPMDATNGRCIGKFFALSSTEASIGAAEVTPINNDFLIVGDSRGYIKVWDISHFWFVDLTCDEQTDKLRWTTWQNFPFVAMRIKIDAISRDSLGPLPLHLTQRCSQAAKPMRRNSDPTFVDERPPHLVNCFRGHLEGITCLAAPAVYKRQLMASSSTDLSVRLWTLEGQFLGVFGQAGCWTDLTPLSTAPIIGASLPLEKLLEERKQTIGEQMRRSSIAGGGASQTDYLPRSSSKEHMTSSSATEHRDAVEVVAEGSQPPKLSADDTALLQQQKQETRGSKVADADSRGKTEKAAVKPVVHTPADKDDGGGDDDDEVDADDDNTPTRPTKKRSASGTGSVDQDDSDSDFVSSKSYERYDVDGALRHCRLRRLAYKEAVELTSRIEHLDKDKDVTQVKMVRLDSGVPGAGGIPGDVRRVASYTTLYVLETSVGTRAASRWNHVRHAMWWIFCFLRSRDHGRSMTDLLRAYPEATKAAPFSNMLMQMVTDYMKRIDRSRSKVSVVSNTSNVGADTGSVTVDALLRKLPGFAPDNQHQRPPYNTTKISTVTECGDDTSTAAAAQDGYKSTANELGKILEKPEAENPESREQRDVRSLYPGREPLLKSSILRKAYSRTLTQYQPLPKLVLPEPLQYECSPFGTLPRQTICQFDGCHAALSDSVKAVQDAFHLRPLECSWQQSATRTDKQDELMQELKQSGWIIRKDGQLKRVQPPGSPINPRRTLLPPKYWTNINRLVAKQAAVGMATGQHLSLISSRSTRRNSAVSHQTSNASVYSYNS